MKDGIDMCGFKSITLNGFDDYVKLVLDGKCLEYTDMYEGCLVKHKNTLKLIRDTTILQLVYRNLVTLLKYKINTFNLSYWFFNNNPTFRDTELSKLIETLKKVEIVKARKLRLNRLSTKEITAVLQFFEPQLLETIQIEHAGKADQFNEIVQLQQWRSANTVTVRFLHDKPTVPLENYFHFNVFQTFVVDFSVDDAIKIRDVSLNFSNFFVKIKKIKLQILLKSPNFIFCHLDFPPYSLNLNDIARVFCPGQDATDEENISFIYKSNDFNFKICMNPCSMKVVKLSKPTKP